MREHKEHKLQKVHPHHKGAGMPYFEKDHWQKNVEDIEVADQKYSHSEMGQAEDYRKSVDALASYAKHHRPKH